MCVDFHSTCFEQFFFSLKFSLSIDCLFWNWIAPIEFKLASIEHPIQDLLVRALHQEHNITFELCAWGFGNVERWKGQLYILFDQKQAWLKSHHRFGAGLGHLWRTGPDISDTWQSLLWNIDINDEVRTQDQMLCLWKWKYYEIISRAVFKGILCKAHPAVGTIQTPSLSARWVGKKKLSSKPCELFRKQRKL